MSWINDLKDTLGLSVDYIIMEEICSGFKVLLKYENGYLYERSSVHGNYFLVKICGDIVLFTSERITTSRVELDSFLDLWMKRGYIIIINGKIL